MTSTLLTTTSTITVAIYFTKFLATPFKQLEIYVKFMKEIQRYTKVKKNLLIKIENYFLTKGFSCGSR